MREFKGRLKRRLFNRKLDINQLESGDIIMIHDECEDCGTSKKLSPNQEAILPEDEKTLIKAGFMNDRLHLNHNGVEAMIHEILIPLHKKELVELAKKRLEEKN